MRDIRFRVWDKRTGEWIDKFRIYPNGLIEFHSGFRANPEWQPYNIENYAIMQYTGLKDKNGKEIYEGDIVKYQGLEGFDYEDKEETISEVAFIDGAFVPVYLSTREHHNYEDEMIVVEDLEVIGNIYENPELLK